MTQRLTQARLDEIERMELPKGRAVIAIAELLAEIDALRAELAGAEERGAARERADVVTHGDVFIAGLEARASKLLVGAFVTAVERGGHVRTGTAAADGGGESQP